MLGNIIAAGASILGGILGQNKQDDIAKRNIQLQKDFAQQGIRWKVDDAKAAGIHPIYALGAPTTSFAPVSVGDSLGPGIRAAGQDISRAINSTSTSDQRLSSTVAALQLERGGLENELLRTQIARMRQNQNPALPSPDSPQNFIGGQGDSGPIKDENKLTLRNPNHPSGEVAGVSDTGYLITPEGWVPAPSKDAKDRIEDIEPHEWTHYFRNNLGPAFGGKLNPPFPAPADMAWVYDPYRGYQLYHLQEKRYVTPHELRRR